VASQVTGSIILAEAALARADREAADHWLGLIAPEVETSTDVQLRMAKAYRDGVVAAYAGRYAEALAALEENTRLLLSQGFVDFASVALQHAATAAIEANDHDAAVRISALVDDLPEAHLTRAVQLERSRIHANAAAASGDNDTAAENYVAALAISRNLGQPPSLGPVLVDYGRWLVETDRAEEAEPLLAEARGLYEKMRAVVWLERIAEIEVGIPAGASS
jgi:tetratricopeptide (TPR) repeat protein